MSIAGKNSPPRNLGGGGDGCISPMQAGRHGSGGTHGRVIGSDSANRSSFRRFEGSRITSISNTVVLGKYLQKQQPPSRLQI
jgi:hypothetical protein